MLNAIKVRTLTVEKTKDFADENGLILRVTPTGSKTWAWRKTVKGRIVKKSLGRWPDVSLQQARKMAMALSSGVEMKAEEESFHTRFKDVVPKWLKEKSAKLRVPHKLDERFNKHILPVIGDVYLDRINDKLLLEKYQYLIDEGKIPTAQRVLNSINEVLRWCVSEGLLDKVKTEYVTSRLPRKPPVIHRAALAPEDLGRLLTPGLKAPFIIWSMYSMLRPKENACLRFEWVDWEKNLLTLPAEVMKMGQPHVVPLARQMVELLKTQLRINEEFGFGDTWVFPSTQSASGHINPATLNIALRRRGLQGICSAHGFRATARTYLARIHVPESVAEACLAHSKANATVAAYNREQFIEERREVMQKWCDFVDTFLLKNE